MTVSDQLTRSRAPRLLDLFCRAGGCSVGYHRAGFDVVGVDNRPQPRYPYEFHQADALTYPLDGFDAIHASPPCQAYSVTASLHTVDHPRLIEAVRTRLTGWLYVIENVEGAAPAMVNPVRLCGSSFGLDVRRHRLFETSIPVMFPPPCAHYLQPEPVDVTGTGARRIGPRPDGGGGNSRKPRNLTEARDAMGIHWMSRRELADAIPPAYTELIGQQLLTHIKAAA
jgi:DNA (cytosine-5)-methyltransferase 1